MSILATLRRVIEAHETLTLDEAHALMQQILRGEASEVEEIEPEVTLAPDDDVQNLITRG